MKKLLFLSLIFCMPFTYAYSLNNEPYNEEYLISVREASTPDEVLESRQRRGKTNEIGFFFDLPDGA